jgi:hypothetical protein
MEEVEETSSCLRAPLLEMTPTMTTSLLAVGLPWKLSLVVEHKLDLELVSLRILETVEMVYWTVESIVTVCLTTTMTQDCATAIAVAMEVCADWPVEQRAVLL